ncbi:MAG: nucleoside phosphorylase [Desulfurococcales archaeon]|nr:nucleoside phosphorylase [Desulfurococcales archaeon]
MSIHLGVREGEVPRRVVVMGDPARVGILAGMLDEATIVSEKRGFKLVRGVWKGSDIGLASHGIGGPSAAIVVEELVGAGARAVVRLGSTGAIASSLRVGDVVLASGAAYYCGGAGLSGYSHPLNACLPASQDPILTYLIHEKLEERGISHLIGPVLSSDSFYAETPDFADYWRARGIVSVEMECAVIGYLSWAKGFRSACVLVVSNIVGGEEHLGSEELSETYRRVAAAVFDAVREVR